MTHIDPDRAQFELFKSLPRDHPIEMLNLVRVRDHAAYPADHPLSGKLISGRQAYESYGRDSAPVLKRVGGSILWRGSFQSTLIGPMDEAWDFTFIARYPDAHAFLAMVKDPEYQRAVIHRQAAVLTSRLIRCAPSDTKDQFA